jgi:hypothetical protein
MMAARPLSRRSTRWQVLGAILVALALALTACGGGDTTTPGTGDPGRDTNGDNGDTGDTSREPTQVPDDFPDDVRLPPGGVFTERINSLQIVDFEGQPKGRGWVFEYLVGIDVLLPETEALLAAQGAEIKEVMEYVAFEGDKQIRFILGSRDMGVEVGLSDGSPDESYIVVMLFDG